MPVLGSVLLAGVKWAHERDLLAMSGFEQGGRIVTRSRVVRMIACRACPDCSQTLCPMSTIIPGKLEREDAQR